MAVDRVCLADVQKAYDFCFNHASEVLPRMKQRVFEHGETGDRITPFERGKEWTFEFLSQYQPRTARQLLGGGEFRLVAQYMGASFSGTGDAYNTHLVQEVNGQVVEIHR